MNQFNGIYKKIIKDNKGVTLIEAVLSIALLGIIGIIFLTMLATSAKVQHQTYNLTTDSYSATSKLEASRGDNYLSGTPSPSSDEIIIKFAEGDWSVQGQTRTEDEGNVQYKVFVPYEIQP